VKKFLKWLGFVVSGLVGIVLVAGVCSYFVSEQKLAQRYERPSRPALLLPTDNASIAEGERFARLAGCQHCHGDAMTGQFIVEIPNIGRFVAPNVARQLPAHSNEELEAAIRDGVRLDGTSSWFMPTQMYHHLNDGDVAKIIAWVRTLPPRDGTTEVSELRPLGRALVAANQLKPGAEEAAALPADPLTDPAQPASRGRYLVMSFCSECHGQKLEGNDLAHAPPLMVAKAYALEDFTQLMHDGTALGGRRLELMREAAIARFSHFTPEEVHDIHAFLSTRSDAS
jgi:cytochrome c553